MQSNTAELVQINRRDTQSMQKVSKKTGNIETINLKSTVVVKKCVGDSPIPSIHSEHQEPETKIVKLVNIPIIPKEYKEKNKCLNTARMLVIIIGLYHQGYYLGIANVLGKVLTRDVYGLSKEESTNRIGDFGSLHSLGGFTALLITGSLTNKFGRINLIIILELVSIIACFLHMIESLPLLLVLRFFDGVLGAMNSILLPGLVNELLPKRVSVIGLNFTYTIVTAFILLGSLSTFIFGGEEGLRRNWKFIISMVGYFGIVRLVFLVFLCCGLESPAWYIDHYWHEKNILKEKVLKVIKKVYEEKSAVEKTKDLIQEEHHLLQKMGLKERKKLQFRELLALKYRKRFLIGIGINIIQQFSGINFLIFFSTQFFDEISNNGALMTLLISIANLASSFVALFLTKFGIGRKIGMQVGAFLIVVAHLGLAFSIYKSIAWMASVSVIIFMIAFGAGLGSMMGAYIIELLPPFGSGLAFSAQFLASSVIVKCVPFALRVFGPEIMILFFAFCVILFICFVMVFVKETKGLSQTEVTELYLGKN